MYTKTAKDSRTETLMPLITRKIAPDSVVYTDCYQICHALDVSNFYHERIHHSTLFANGNNHINGIQNSWGQAKRALRNMMGFPKGHSRYS